MFLPLNSDFFEAVSAIFIAACAKAFHYLKHFVIS